MASRLTYIVDDDPALRSMIVRMLETAGTQTAEFASAEIFLEGYSERPSGCVLLDVRLPGMSGLELLERAANLPPRHGFVMLSGFGDIRSAVRAVQMGAMDFIQKPFRKEELLRVVDEAFQKLDERASSVQEFDALTPREREVLIAFADGAANKVVADRLQLSPRTIEMHRARIFKKLGVSNLSQALLRAREARITP